MAKDLLDGLMTDLVEYHPLDLVNSSIRHGCFCLSLRAQG